LDATLRALAAERRWRLDPTDRESLIQCMSSWQPYAETGCVVGQLQARDLRTALVASASSRILSHTLRQLDIDFEVIVLSEECRSYRPDPAALEELIGLLRVDPQQVLHISGDFLSDIPVAHDLGCK